MAAITAIRKNKCRGKISNTVKTVNTVKTKKTKMAVPYIFSGPPLLRRKAVMNVAFFLLPKSKVSYLYDDNTVRQGLEMIQRYGYTAVPVITRSGEYVGIVSEGDFLRNILCIGSVDMYEMESVRISSVVSRKRADAVNANVGMDDILEKAVSQNFIPVVDDRNVFMGIITRQSVIKYLMKK